MLGLMTQLRTKKCGGVDLKIIKIIRCGLSQTFEYDGSLINVRYHAP